MKIRKKVPGIGVFFASLGTFGAAKNMRGALVAKSYSLQEFPLFVKARAIIPLAITNDYTPLGDATLKEKQTVLVYADGQSDYQFHRPDGEGTKYQNVEIEFNEAEGKLRVKAQQRFLTYSW